MGRIIVCLFMCLLFSCTQHKATSEIDKAEKLKEAIEKFNLEKTTLEKTDLKDEKTRMQLEQTELAFQNLAGAMKDYVAALDNITQGIGNDSVRKGEEDINERMRSKLLAMFDSSMTYLENKRLQVAQARTHSMRESLKYKEDPPSYAEKHSLTKDMDAFDRARSKADSINHPH